MYSPLSRVLNNQYRIEKLVMKNGKLMYEFHLIKHLLNKRLYIFKCFCFSVLILICVCACLEKIV